MPFVRTDCISSRPGKRSRASLPALPTIFEPDLCRFNATDLVLHPDPLLPEKRNLMGGVLLHHCHVPCPILQLLLQLRVLHTCGVELIEKVAA